MANIPSKPSYTHGSTGSAPSIALDYASGDPVDEEHMDYYVNTPLETIKALIDVHNALDSDGDNVVDAADGASSYSDGGSQVVLHPTDINFADKLSVTDDGDSTVTIDTSALDHEEVEDVVDGLLVGGTNINLTYDDNANTLTIDGFSGSHQDLTSVTETDHHGEPVTFETGHSSWGNGLSNEEIHRIELQAGEEFEVARLELQQKGGGSSSNMSIDVYDVDNTTEVGSADLGSVSKNPGTSGSGATILIRIANSTGSAVKASVRVVGYINGA